MNDGAYDEALVRFSECGPEFGPGLSNHGPMAADALIALGRADALDRWSEWYAHKLAPAPRGIGPIARDDWREALGDVKRAADWSGFFERELDGRDWHEAVREWVPRLAPGIMAGATHGLLRTAHAVRALERDENSVRVQELGEGLAYWAARYQALPASAAAPGRLGVSEALEQVPRAEAPAGAGFLIFDRVRGVEATDFAPVINLVDVSVGLDEFIDDVTSTFVRVYLANARRAVIAFVHTVTAPSALRFLVPNLDADAMRDLMRYAWQSCAAIHATYAREPLVRDSDVAEVDEQDLVEQAVDARDEHAIKFTEACLRAFRRSGDGAFIEAAQDAVVRLRASG